MPDWDRRQWFPPPEDVRAEVARVLGPAFWPRLESAWVRALQIDPGMRATQWYRSPEETLRQKLATPQRAAWLTQHGLGLAVDITPSKARAEELRKHFSGAGLFVSTYPGQTGHFHVAALSNAAWARSPLRDYLARRLAPLRPRLTAGR